MILFWTLYFDGSKSNDGAGAGCILVSPEGEKTMLACRLNLNAPIILLNMKHWFKVV
jgi:hypothetical protein